MNDLPVNDNEEIEKQSIISTHNKEEESASDKKMSEDKMEIPHSVEASNIPETKSNEKIKEALEVPKSANEELNSSNAGLEEKEKSKGDLSQAHTEAPKTNSVEEAVNDSKATNGISSKPEKKMEMIATNTTTQNGDSEKTNAESTKGEGKISNVNAMDIDTKPQVEPEVKSEMKVKEDETKEKETTKGENEKEINNENKKDESNKSSDSLEIKEEEAEEDDEEEMFMKTLEEEEGRKAEKESEKHKTLEEDSNAAPTLLRAALNDGGGEKLKSKKQKVAKNTEQDEEDAEDEENEKDKLRDQFEERGNQLDFLLSKASEYSNFIQADLKELQKEKIAEAQAEINKKKRKRNGKDTTYVGGNAPIFVQPKNLAKGCILKDYQLEGVRWLISLYENGVSGILADEMGLGKTIQVISVIAHLRSKKVSGPFLIVVPLATLPNWVREFKKWIPEINVIRYHGHHQSRTALWKGALNPKMKRQPEYPVIVTSYEIAIKDRTKLAKLGEYKYLVVDEGHRLKNHRCTLISSLKKIPAANRLLLSGTPIQNNLDELWSLLNFVNPQIFDDLSVFQSWFGFRDIGFRNSKTHTNEDEILLEQRTNSTVSKLHECLRPFLLRRVKKDVLTELPPKQEVIVYSGMSKLQVGFFNAINQEKLHETVESMDIAEDTGTKISQINNQMNHRKNSNHPFLFGEPRDQTTGLPIGSAYPQLLIRASGKFALLDRMLLRLKQDDHQVLIFSQMTSVLSIMEDYLNYRQWKYCRIDGSTDIDERQKQMDSFNSSKSEIFAFLLSTRAGGLGINLTAADTCIIFDSDWNPHQDSQAMDRCHRIGQTRPVAVYRLLTIGTVDIEMMEKQMSKKKLERMAIVGGDFRKAGSRSRGEFNTTALKNLLADDIKDIQKKGISSDSVDLNDSVQDIQIDDDEFNLIMDRKTLFSEDMTKEGKMYDLVDSNVQVLGAIKG